MRYTTVNCIYTVVIESNALQLLDAHSSVCRRIRKVAKMGLLASSCVCLSVLMEQVFLHWTDFQQILYLDIFRKFVEKI
jgi:hypothetical protein